MTLDQLKSIMKFQLKNFNDEGISINDRTIHDDVLDEKDGFGQVNSVKLYKDVIRFTLIRQGHEDRQWPGDWLQHTVEQLAEKII